LLFIFSSSPVFARTTSSSLSLSDEVYADLALRGQLNNVSVSLQGDNEKDSITINDTKHWIPASTVKLFAAMYAFKQIAGHKLNLYDTVIVDEKNVVPTELVTDELPTIQAGSSPAINRLLRQMITQSDNTAFNVLLDVLGRKAITQYIQSLGLLHSTVGSKLNLDTSQQQYEFDNPGYGINTTTAQDYTKAFTLVLQNKIPGAKPLIEILKQQKINYMLPLFLPKNVVVAHKHGDLEPLYHDGGIVFKGKSPYVVSVFSNAGDPNLVAHLSELIYTRDPKLVGASVQTPAPVSQIYPPIDPLVAQGTLLPSSILGAMTQPVETLLITAADLGITAKDLSLARPTAQLPKVIIPADSPWHFLILTSAFIKQLSFSDKARSQAGVNTMLLEISEAKDLITRGKTQQANAIFQNMQQRINTLTQTATVKNNAQTQVDLQTLSETRFQILGDQLKTTSGEKRNELIKMIAQQAKSTVNQVQPNLPLAVNATNLTQKPLIGEVVDKNATSVVVKTAGGQQLTIPLNKQSLTVKTKEVTKPTTKLSLSSVKIGTTIAVVGSSVGNSFTPTFVLINVPTELAAPEPVTVVKVDQKNHTMVILENGIPVQVSVGDQTIIKGSDTSISFDQIKSGDVVVVHGKPLTSIVKPNNTISPTLLPTISTTPGTRVSITPQSKTDSENVQPTSYPSSASSVKSSPQTKTQKSESQPKVIQSTSIQVIEKKEDAAKAPLPQTHQSQPEQKQQESSHEQSKNQPQTSQKDQSAQSNPPEQQKTKASNTNKEQKK